MREAKLSYEGCRWSIILLRVQEGKKIQGVQVGKKIFLGCRWAKRFFGECRWAKRYSGGFRWTKKIFGRFRWVGKMIASTYMCNFTVLKILAWTSILASSLFLSQVFTRYSRLLLIHKFCHSFLKKLPMPSNFCL